jgi:Flp pilus assembly protein TadB
MTKSEKLKFYALVGRRLILPLLLIALAIAFLLSHGITQLVVALIGIVACVVQIVLAVRRRRHATANRKQE